MIVHGLFLKRNGSSGNRAISRSFVGTRAARNVTETAASRALRVVGRIEQARRNGSGAPRAVAASERRRQGRRWKRLPTRPVGERGWLRVRLTHARLGPITNAIREHSSQAECLICGESGPVVVRTAEVQRL